MFYIVRDAYEGVLLFATEFLSEIPPNIEEVCVLYIQFTVTLYITGFVKFSLKYYKSMHL